MLTNTLRDKLVASARARVVTVAFEGARWAGRIDSADDLTSTTAYSRRQPMTRYFGSKLMDIMFSQELGRRLAGTGVTTNCCDPGFNTTGLGRDLPFAGLLEKLLHALRIGDPRRGARIIVRLATDPAFAETTGGYPRSTTPPHLPAQNPDVVREFRPTCGRARPLCSTGSSSRTDEAPPAGNGSTPGGTRIRPGWRLLQQRW
ncbi:MAG: hypothetical protein QOC76_2441 [Mycobacterium sp.]|nr:hypothetical protein [Mycobacterium sp.]